MQRLFETIRNAYDDWRIRRWRKARDREKAALDDLQETIRRIELEMVEAGIDVGRPAVEVIWESMVRESQRMKTLYGEQDPPFDHAAHRAEIAQRLRDKLRDFDEDS